MTIEQLVPRSRRPIGLWGRWVAAVTGVFLVRTIGENRQPASPGTGTSVTRG